MLHRSRILLVLRSLTDELEVCGAAHFHVLRPIRYGSYCWIVNIIANIAGLIIDGINMEMKRLRRDLDM